MYSWAMTSKSFAGGSANNMRILIDAPKSMNIARSAALEKYKEVEEPGNMVHHYKDKELSKEAKEKIRAIIMDDRKKAGKIYHAGAAVLEKGFRLREHYGRKQVIAQRKPRAFAYYKSSVKKKASSLKKANRRFPCTQTDLRHYKTRRKILCRW